MRLTTKALFFVLTLSLQARAEEALSGFIAQGSEEPQLLDPRFLEIGADQDMSAGAVYGVALYDLNKKVATFVPVGDTEEESLLSAEQQKKRLQALIKKAKLANLDPNAKTISYLLLSNGSVQIIEAKADDPSSLKSKILELEVELRRLRVESSSEFKERVQNKHDFATPAAGHGKKN